MESKKMARLNSASANSIFSSTLAAMAAEKGEKLTLAFCQGNLNRPKDDSFFYTVRVEDKEGCSYRYSSDGVCARLCGSLRSALVNARWNEGWRNTPDFISFEEFFELLNKFPAYVTLYKVTKSVNTPDWDNAEMVGRLPLKQIPNWESYI